MNRDEMATELLLRENIRRSIKAVKTKKLQEQKERILSETMLRKLIRSILSEAAVPDEVPNRSTGINVLEELLKKIIPVLEEDIDVKVSDDNPEDDRFIDIEPEKEMDPKDDFSKGLEGSNLDQTGRNVAFNSFKKIEQNILDSYELLDNEKDAKIFYDYLLTNVKLYFDKFEDELSGSVPDITTPEYEEAQLDTEEPVEDTEL